MARRLGTGVREMKDAVSDMDPRSVFDDKDEPPKPKSMPAIEAAAPAADPIAEAVAVPENVVAPDAIGAPGDDPPAPPAS